MTIYDYLWLYVQLYFNPNCTPKKNSYDFCRDFGPVAAPRIQMARSNSSPALVRSLSSAAKIGELT
jgi:hypothetical protein